MDTDRKPGKNRRPEKINENDDFILGTITHVRQSKKVESRILVLDYLSEGKGFGQTKQREPIIQGIGTTWFTLLELTVERRGKYPQFEEISIRGEEKSPIQKVKRRLSINDITNTGYQSLEDAVLRIINKNEKRFVSFFNKAQPITNRIHSLQLIPGIGKKLMWEILESRKSMPFVSFSDIEERVKISDISKMILNRIMQELEEDQKHRLFTVSKDSNLRK
ncbi:MAG: DUF655 domain-containing protein [Candidatus Heimdallarchaeota archaeon]|nr:DUF655 domain-containing protein [Candidatus Heimdallarchaeota archaeon]MCK4953908.1 DUF655 domain-containing protein [Candidatus Heimdallarchaeota archaeon]